MQWNKSPSRRSATTLLAAQLAFATLLVIFLVGPKPTAAMAPPSSAQDDTREVDDSASKKGVDPPASSKTPNFRTEKVRGRVVWLAEALKEQFGISSVPEASERNLALVTADGEVIPLVENTRGRAFRKDKRLREMDVEVLLRRHQKQPMAQVLRLYELRDGKRFEVDYWCDVCAIPMYETGPCSCCQDDNRLRKRLIEESP